MIAVANEWSWIGAFKILVGVTICIEASLQFRASLHSERVVASAWVFAKLAIKVLFFVFIEADYDTIVALLRLVRLPEWIPASL